MALEKEIDRMNTIDIRECVECGARSVPYFGMFTGCRYNGGSHRNMIKIQVDAQIVAKTLKAAYSSVPWFDRASFDKNAKPWMKQLLEEIR